MSDRARQHSDRLQVAMYKIQLHLGDRLLHLPQRRPRGAGMQLARHYLAQDSGQLLYGVGLVQEFKARGPVLRQDMAVT
jgi:hypothetical protein